MLRACAILRRPARRAACARGRRSRCRSRELARARRPRAAEQRRELPRGRRRGSLTRYGVADDVVAGSETASSTPLRSVIVPRCAGTATSLDLLAWRRRCAERAALERAELAARARRRGEQDEEDREEQADAALDQAHRLARRVRAAGRRPPARRGRGCVAGAARWPRGALSRWRRSRLRCGGRWRWPAARCRVAGRGASPRSARRGGSVAAAPRSRPAPSPAAAGSLRRRAGVGRGLRRGRLRGAARPPRRPQRCAARVARRRATQVAQRAGGGHDHAELRGLRSMRLADEARDLDAQRRRSGARASASCSTARPMPGVELEQRDLHGDDADQRDADQPIHTRPRIRRSSRRESGSAAASARSQRRRRIAAAGTRRGGARPARAARPDAARARGDAARGRAARARPVALGARRARRCAAGGVTAASRALPRACGRRAGARTPRAGCRRPRPASARSSGGRAAPPRLAAADADGRSGGQMQPRARSARKRLTRRSSSEWKEIAASRPPSRSSVPGERQRRVELAELVVDGDADRLEGALGRDGRRRSAPARGSRR